MQEANKDKIRNLINRTFRSLPTANDLPRLLRCISVYSGSEKVFPKETSLQEADTVDLLFKLLQELTQALDNKEEELITSTFDKYFQRSLSTNLCKKADKSPIPNLALKEALATLPNAFLAGNEHANFWISLDKPNLDLLIQLCGKELKIDVGTPTTVQVCTSLTSFASVSLQEVVLLILKLRKS